MAHYSNALTEGQLTASADLSTKQYHFVKMSGDNTVDVCAAITDNPVGVLCNNPTSGQAAVVQWGGIAKIVANATLAAGDVIGTSADGQADPIVNGVDVTVFVVGTARKAAAAGDVVEAFINITNTLAT